MEQSRLDISRFESRFEGIDPIKKEEVSMMIDGEKDSIINELLQEDNWNHDDVGLYTLKEFLLSE